MAKKHDENRDLKSVARVARIDYSNKSIKCSKNATIGIHMWGRIDYLTKYCCWFLIWDNTAGAGGYVGNEDSTKTSRETKKAKKEPKLTDKTKKIKKK